MNNISDVFFDLDRTLWDFDYNAHKTLIDIYKNFNLKKFNIDLKQFIDRYTFHNEYLWSLYRNNKISKSLLRSERFGLTLNEFSVYNNDLAVKIGNEYIKKCPLQTTLFPYAIEILNYLKTKYKLHIITNGFDEVQHIKLKASGLTHFFNEIVTSEKVDVKKPDPKIFNYALTKAKTTSMKSIMIGDDLPVDILGAKQVGMSQIYFNPDKKNHNEEIDYEISSLDQIKDIL